MARCKLPRRNPSWNCWRAGDEPLGSPVQHVREAHRGRLAQHGSPERRPAQTHPQCQQPLESSHSGIDNLSPGLRRKLAAHLTPEPELRQDQGPEVEQEQEQELGHYHDQGNVEEMVEDLPQLWSPALDTLMRQTSRAYDLVLAYPRDAEGGLRWYTSDIPRIRKVGRHLHHDMWALKHWQRKVKEHGNMDKKTVRKIEKDAENMWDLCKKVQRVIGELEQKNEYELLKTGEFELDEEGRIVKVSKRGVEEQSEQVRRRRIEEASDDTVQFERESGRAASSPLFHRDTEPSGMFPHPRSASYSRSRSSSIRSRDRAQYGGRLRRKGGRNSRGEYDSYRPDRNTSPRHRREDSHVSRRGGSTGGPGKIGKHALHY